MFCVIQSRCSAECNFLGRVVVVFFGILFFVTQHGIYFIFYILFSSKFWAFIITFLIHKMSQLALHILFKFFIHYSCHTLSRCEISFQPRQTLNLQLKLISFFLLSDDFFFLLLWFFRVQYCVYWQEGFILILTNLHIEIYCNMGWYWYVIISFATFFTNLRPSFSLKFCFELFKFQKQLNLQFLSVNLA